MPAHIYIRVGRYADAISTNEHAVHADESYIRDQRPEASVYTVGYYPHNYDFLAFAASLAGRRGQAVAAADRVPAVIVPELLGAPGLDFLQHLVTRPLKLRIRFGLWDEIIAAAAPPPNLPHATGMWRYARGRAFAARGDAAGAEAELAQLRELAASDALKNVKLEFNMAPAVLNVAVHTLAGQIAAARQNYGLAAEQLMEAARLEDAFVYGEPPEWTVPVRQELGEVLLTAGRAPDAERAFREDLKRFPENGWSLNGLARALRAQGRNTEAVEVEARFRRAWEGADVKLAGSLD
jgi:tetratricopeptide (TPR) repeat protein